jgi:hypothetical protein
VLKLLGIIGLVALILVGALLPLRYTSRMHLPKSPPPAGSGGRADTPAREDAPRED